MQLRDAEVQLSAQRLRELMLWHGKDEGNLPPAATLVNLSRDTIAALGQLQSARTQLAEMRTALSELFWSSDSSAIRVALLTALGPPPNGSATSQEPPTVTWQPSVTGLPLPALATDAPGAAAVLHRATG
ncbi:MAG TPA: hypothetical protein VK700_06160 [Steroidobacteraceae bacterium]|jgi:hypothetical protein|nr:hypothetical protein [Steroidobacteraceae bacterium]